VARILLGSVLLLVPAIGTAQMEATLPDAPSAVAAGAPADSEPAELVADAAPRIDAIPMRQSFAARPESAPEEQAVYSAEETPVSFIAAPQGGSINLAPLFSAMSRPALSAGVNSADAGSTHYGTRGMLWQSLGFIGTENAFRLMTDHNMRRLTADAPYWHNYIASLKQWNMRRWWDGDDFLVDDVGHPMQGGVSSFIEIQNSPRQRDLRFGMNREYWRSRFLAMMWSTVFSTQQKIGPLGEAALGSDGAINYPLNCAYPCRTYKPGQPYTNNTGWTDFIITPTVGTVWVLLEDFLDLEVSDRIQNAHPDAAFAKIVRGAINPCRTMANAMRWRKPWYRDFQHETADLHITRAIHFEPGDDDYIHHAPHFDFFPHYNVISLPVNTLTCSHCRQSVTGYGVGFSARLGKWADFDSDLNYMSKVSALPSDRAGGDATLGTFGFRSGFSYKHYSIKAAVRPGFLSYDHAYETTPTKTDPKPQVGQITHFVAALAINGDININRHLALRGVIGNTPVRYRDTYINRIQTKYPPYISWLSPKIFLTNENWSYQTGAVLRF
jgi:hypothetical protein